MDRKPGAPEPRPNCWEHLDCGRQPGGRNVAELGVCPAATAAWAHGLNGGRAAGRICWAVAGTFCEGVVQGIDAVMKHACHECDFLELVQEQEGRFDFELVPPSLPDPVESEAKDEDPESSAPLSLHDGSKPAPPEEPDFQLPGGESE